MGPAPNPPLWDFEIAAIRPGDNPELQSWLSSANCEKTRLDSIGEGKPYASINILQSMRMADYEWRNVTETTIKIFFIKAGFSENKTSTKTEDVESIKHSIGEGEINSEQWASLQKDCNTNISFEDFLDVDNELQTCGTIIDKEIVENINKEISDEENEELDQKEREKVTVKEAEKAVELLRSFLESIENIGAESFGAFATLE
ncbi:hypothetical protein AVEN_141511-1, partial [Araneus ventricosus]